MRTILTFCFLAILGISGNAFAQKSDVKIKKNTVYINGSECLTVDQSLAGISFTMPTAKKSCTCNTMIKPMFNGLHENRIRTTRKGDYQSIFHVHAQRVGSPTL